jgi:26S proteasome regulatory subunit N10
MKPLARFNYLCFTSIFSIFANNSHLLNIPPGPHLLSDALFGTPIINGEDGPPPGFSSNSFEFGVDPSVDPELAMALRMSLEEEQARLNALEKPVNQESNPKSTEDEELAAALALSMGVSEDVDMEDPELAQAIKMSQEVDFY